MFNSIKIWLLSLFSSSVEKTPVNWIDQKHDSDSLSEVDCKLLSRYVNSILFKCTATEITLRLIDKFGQSTAFEFNDLYNEFTLTLGSGRKYTGHIFNSNQKIITIGIEQGLETISPEEDYCEFMFGHLNKTYSCCDNRSENGVFEVRIGPVVSILKYEVGSLNPVLQLRHHQITMNGTGVTAAILNTIDHKNHNAKGIRKAISDKFAVPEDLLNVSIRKIPSKFGHKLGIEVHYLGEVFYYEYGVSTQGSFQLPT